MSNASGVTSITIRQGKSVGLAILLAVLFGPLGMLYATVVGALVMIVVTFLVALFTVGLGLVLTWPICILWAALAVAGDKTTVHKTV